MNIKPQLENIFKLLNTKEYVKAHALLEDLWRKYKNQSDTREESYILKAFVNASVYFEVYNMQRLEHAKNLWNTYEKYKHLIYKLETINKEKYLEIKQLLEKRKELIDDNIRF